MKKTALILAILMAVSSSAFGAFTVDEEVTLRQFIKNKAKIVDLVQRADLLNDVADGITNETLPLQITQKRAERITIIATRDAEVAGIKAAAIIAVNAKSDEHQPAIDTVNGEISALEAQL